MGILLTFSIVRFAMELLVIRRSTIHKFANLLLAPKRLLSLTLDPLPHWGRGEKAEPISCRMVTKPGDIIYSLSARFGGEGWGEGAERPQAIPVRTVLTSLEP